MATWNSTINSLTRKAIVYNDSLLAIDETGQSLDERNILTAIYQLAGGQGKDRLTDDSWMYGWRVIFLSSSENSLDQLAQKAKMKLMDGQRARLVDIGAEISPELGAFQNIHDSDSPKRFADALNNACMKYYGTAGKAYLAELVNWITTDQIGLREWLTKKMTYYNESAGINLNAGTQGRIAERFALVYAAGRLAHKFKILPWKMKALCEAGNHCHKRVLLPLTP